MEIKNASPKDCEAISQIIVKNLDEILRNYHSEQLINILIGKNQPHDIVQQLQRKEIFVMEIDGSTIWTGALANFWDVNTPKWCISNLFVLPEFQGQKWGSEMFLYLKNLCTQRQISPLHVPSSKNALGFYKKMWFQEDALQPEDEITRMTLNLK